MEEQVIFGAVSTQLASFNFLPIDFSNGTLGGDAEEIIKESLDEVAGQDWVIVESNHSTKIINPDNTGKFVRSNIYGDAVSLPRESQTTTQKFYIVTTVSDIGEAENTANSPLTHELFTDVAFDPTNYQFFFHDKKLALYMWHWLMRAWQQKIELKVNDQVLYYDFNHEECVLADIVNVNDNFQEHVLIVPYAPLEGQIRPDTYAELERQKKLLAKEPRRIHVNQLVKVFDHEEMVRMGEQKEETRENKTDTSDTVTTDDSSDEASPLDEAMEDRKGAESD